MNIEINAVKLTFELIDKETGEVITKEATLGDFKDKKVYFDAEKYLEEKIRRL